MTVPKFEPELFVKCLQDEKVQDFYFHDISCLRIIMCLYGN